MSDLQIDYEGLKAKVAIIEQDIKDIEGILGDVKDATNTFDDSTWKSSEKKKMDQDYVPYVNKIAINIPNALRNHLNMIKKSSNLYQEVEEEIKEKASQLADADIVRTEGNNE